MSCCVNTHALLSALVLRVERDGYAVTSNDLRALLGAGCKREDVERALAKEGKAFEHALAVLASLATPDR
jgi:FAD/FMN-containing dehydrogenase